MKNEFEKARSFALRALVYRRRTRHELELRLEQKGFTPEVSRLVLDMLMEYGYIDDIGFARWWVDQRLGKRGFKGLKRELRGKGICSGIIDKVLNELGCDAEYHAAMKLVKKELLRNRGACDPPRLASALNRRGFSCEVINKVCYSIRDGKRDWI